MFTQCSTSLDLREAGIYCELKSNWFFSQKQEKKNHCVILKDHKSFDMKKNTKF